MKHAASHTRPPRILAVYAHPDDESFCAGGTLARAVARGAEVMVVSFTRGEAGQIHDPEVATRRTLGQTRALELQKACRQLGVQEAVCLDFGDGRLNEVGHGTLVAEVTRIIRSFRPNVVLTFGADGAYGHPDHIAIGAATDAAVMRAGDRAFCPEQVAAGLQPHAPDQLFHSHFPRQDHLLMGDLVRWQSDQTYRFRGSPDFVRGLPVFANSMVLLGYCRDYVHVEWFPPGFHVVEQGEAPANLYFILSGSAASMDEQEDGGLVTLAELRAGEFFGETALASGQPQQAHVVALDGLSCLVFSPQQPANFAGRGAQACFTGEMRVARSPREPASICVDTCASVSAKMAAIAAHRTQIPITPDMLPQTVLRDLLGREFFVCAYAKQEHTLMAGILPAAPHHRLPRLPRGIHRPAPVAWASKRPVLAARRHRQPQGARS